VHIIRGDFRVLNRQLSFAALVVLGAAAPAVIAIAAPPAAAPAKPAAGLPNRAGMLNSMGNNFKAIDTNGDGTLNAAELQAAEAKVQQNRLNAVRARVEAEFTKLARAPGG
jgi:hypothetical protein